MKKTHSAPDTRTGQPPASPVPKGSPNGAQTQVRQNGCVTCGGDAVKTNKRIETRGCSAKDPIKAKRHKPSRAQRAQARGKEGKRKNMDEEAISTGAQSTPQSCPGSSVG